VVKIWPTSVCLHLKIHFNIILPSILTFPSVHIKVRAGRPMNNLPSTAPDFTCLRHNGHRSVSYGVKRLKREANAQFRWATTPILPYVMAIRCLTNHRANCKHASSTVLQCPKDWDLGQNCSCKQTLLS
jgi:hypothetical protein